MSQVKLNAAVPDFEVQATDDQTFRLSDLQGKNVVLYFYPKDSTPGCTTEGQDFRDHFDKFQKLNAEIYGISRDSIKSHENFKNKQCFPFELISDEDGRLCEAFGVLKEKTNYGKTYIGIERSTFIIDRKGVLRAEMRGVKVDGHVLHVLEELKKL